MFLISYKPFDIGTKEEQKRWVEIGLVVRSRALMVEWYDICVGNGTTNWNEFDINLCMKIINHLRFVNRM